MKTGRSLNDIAAELTRQRDTRKDYLAPQGQIEAKVIEGEVVLDGFNGHPLGANAHAHAQLSDLLEIPKRYYDRMNATQPALLAANLNTWLKAKPAEKRMFRSIDGKVRGVLSQKYRPLDNFELAQAVLPTLLENKVEIMSCELTETRMFIKGILPSLSDALPEGMAWGQGHHMVGRDGRLVAAITISNSEVGAGALKVEPGVFTTWCTNLATLTKASMKKYHVGRSFEADDNFEVFRNETRELDDRAFFMKVKDVTMAAFAEGNFKAAIAQIRDAAKVEIISTELPKVVEVMTKRLALPEGLQGSILTHLARGGDLTKWGLSSAVTRAANDFDDYEGATDLERAGGQILALEGRDWDAIATAQ